MNEISLRIKEIRDKLNLKNSDIAKKAGIPNQNLTDYIKNGKMPSAEKLGKIATALNVSVDYLVFGTEEYKDLIEEQLLDAFRQLDHDNKVIAAGEIMKLLTMQELNNKKD